jgi:excisionase family DNA binding protein
VKLLTIAETADRLHLSSNTVRALCCTRKLRHERHGLGRGKILIPEDAIEEYRLSVTVPATPSGAADARPQPEARRAPRALPTLKNLTYPTRG